MEGMSNPGVYPLDPSTPVGQFRVAYPDKNSVPLDPVVAGQQDYEKFSDLEIEGFLALGSGSILRAIGYALLQKASAAAEESSVVKDYDLSIDLTKKANDLREQAAEYFALADQSDLSGEDAFVPFNLGLRGAFIPEGTIPQWGRRYTWDRYYR